MQNSLLSEVTIEEIFYTLKSMPRNTILGPDGYTMEFFLVDWDVVGTLFVVAVKEFFCFW